jgi:hypothetical protein
MAKADSPNTTNLSPWRAAQLRQKARGKGKHPMPHGRYSATKKTLRDGVVARPQLTLSPAQIEALEELCTLSTYSMGFTYSPAMARVCKAIADKAGPAARADYFARASKRERVELRA